MQLPRLPTRLPLSAILIGSAAVALYYYLFRQVDHAWWRWDDPQILLHAQKFSPWESYFSPGKWRQLSAAHLTPWLPVSFGIDLRLFGLSPTAFYGHQIAALTLACILLYVVARQWYSRTAALAAPLFFVLSPTTSAITQQLMTRHYIEGLLFSLAAVWFFVRAVRRQCVACSLLAALFYLLAASSKEVYVPLVVLLVFLPDATFRQRLTYALPALFAAAIYTVWRILMLGVAIGGYDGMAADFGAVLGLPMASMSYLFGPGQAALWVLAVAIAMILLEAVRHRSALGLVAIVCSLTPLLAIAISSDISGVNTPRYLLVVVVFLGFLASHAVSLASRLTTAPVALCCVIILLWIPMAPRATLASESLAQQGRILELQGQFLWNQPPQGILWVHLGGFQHYLTGLRAMKGEDDLILAADEIEVQRAAQHHSNLKLWRYDASCQCVRDFGQDIDANLRSWRRRLRNVDLTARFWLTSNGVVSWSFGPYEKGAYSVINGKIFGKLPMPRVGGIRTGLRQFEVTVRFDSTEGWTTYSAPIGLDFSASSQTAWSRPPAKPSELP